MTESTISDIVTTLRSAGCVFAEDEARLLVAAAASPTDLLALVRRRVAGLPLEHVLGWAEFCGLRIAVDPGVFVPRRRTGFLVDQVVLTYRASVGHRGRAVVVDLCCGAGGIGIGVAVAAGLGGAELHAADVDPVAVRCARRNVEPVGGRVWAGDLYEALPASLRGRVDMLVVNAPYVPTDAIELMPAEARLYEPRLALDGGSDGLDVQRRVIAAAPQWLAPGGSLAIETSERQAPSTAKLMATIGLAVLTAGSEELDATVVIGKKSPASE